jgi:hypothetical protein
MKHGVSTREDGTPARTARTPSRGKTWFGAALVVLASGLLIEAKLWRPDTLLTIRENVQIAEAKAWWNARLDLPERKWDTALKDGLVYSHFPPMFSLIAAGVVPFFHGVPHAFIVVALLLPVQLLAYALFYRRTGSWAWGALLAMGLVCGTSLLPVIDKTLRGASPYFVNHTLAMIGLLIMLVESFGRRRVWVAAIGLIVAALSRQMTIVYALPLALLAFKGAHQRAGIKPVTTFATTVFFVILVSCTLNALKFGRPWDSGYMHVYTDRAEDRFSRDAKTYGLFSTHYVPRNLYYANLGFPKVYRIEIAGQGETHLRPNHMGTGIWWTTPLLLLVFLDMGSIVRDPLRRAWLAAAILASAGLLFYHSTGYDQRGFNRYSLDYVPVILALIAPRCVTGRGRWISSAMIAWSILYFRWLI